MNVHIKLKYLILGIVISEAFFLTLQIFLGASRVSNFSFGEAIALNGLYFIFVTLLAAKRPNSEKVINSLLIQRRWDIFLFIFIGMLIPASSMGLLDAFTVRFAGLLTPTQCLIFLLIIPLCLTRDIFGKAYNPSTDTLCVSERFFISDREIQSSEEDKLGYVDLSRRFADRLLDTEPNDVMVFGLDAPWGIGKSSFVNLCIEHWHQHKAQPIVYEFNPTSFDEEAQLIEKFTSGLIKEINRSVYIPELAPLMNDYTKLILSNSRFSFFGFEAPFPASPSIPEAFSRLESTIQRLEKRIIVVIDDLDRVEISRIKQVLYIVRKSYSFPNVNYLLCYDSNNIIAHERSGIETSNVSEYLEKYVGAKISLFLSGQALSSYLKQTIDQSLEELRLADRSVLSRIVGEISSLLESPNNFKYAPLIGNVRKLKKLINIILYIDVAKSQLNNLSIDVTDLVHLLLLYINYPSIFRDIYIAESGENTNVFSLTRHYDQSNSRYLEENTAEYDEYLKKDIPENARFLLKQLFDAQTRLGEQDDFDSISEEQRRSWACFNNRQDLQNLRDYLNLIVEFSSPPKASQYKFHLNLFESIRAKEIKDSLFSQQELNPIHGEIGHQLFWQVVTNSINEVTPGEAEIFLNLAKKELPNYSIVEIDEIGIGARRHVIYSIAHILDRRGWEADQPNTKPKNTDKNLIQVSEKLLAKDGIIELFLSSNRLPIGLYDALLLRLISSPARKNDLWNLSSSLIKRKDLIAQTSGATIELAKVALEEISLLIFSHFYNDYIKVRNSIFIDIDKLSKESMLGLSSEFVDKSIENQEISEDYLDKRIGAFKNTLKSFIIFQLASSLNDNDIGCGYFSFPASEDGNSQKINELMNNYLFEVCFKPSDDGYIQFLDFLMRSMSSDLFEGTHFFSFSNVRYLDLAKLKRYWKTNRKQISKIVQRENRTVHTQNFSVQYTDVAGQIIKEMDNFNP